MPATQAPLSVWQAWATQQTKAVESVPWETDYSNTGCQVEDLWYISVPLNRVDPEAPLGVNVMSVAIAANCDGPSQAGHAMGVMVNPSPPGNCTGVNYGEECANQYGSGSNVTDYLEYDDTSGTNNNFKGHVEISTPPAGSCGPGTLIANLPSSGDEEFSTGTSLTYYWMDVNYDFVAGITLWEYVSSGDYNNWGTACAAF